MKTITIIEGVTLTASVATLNAYLIEKADIDVERLEREEEMELLRWLADPANHSDPLYSDIYKDVHGFRPRW